MGLLQTDAEAGSERVGRHQSAHLVPRSQPCGFYRVFYRTIGNRW